MPRSAKKPCAKAGCGALVERRDRFCEEHGGNTNWKSKQSRDGNTTQRGYGHSWRKLRAKALERDHYCCVIHGAQGKLAPATEVDHIKSKAAGGQDALDNLQSLCVPCHRTKTATEA